MHCRACDKELSERESTRRYLEIDEYIDLCHKCTVESGILYKENQFLADKHDDEEYIPTEQEIWGDNAN